MQPKVVMFGGPNGSGKSTIKANVLDEIGSIEIYINADDMVRALTDHQQLSFDPYRITLTTESWEKRAYSGSLFEKLKAGIPVESIKIAENTIHISAGLSKESLEAIGALTAQVVRDLVFESGQSLAYETVMSHAGKVEFLRRCRNAGYEVTLIYLSTNSPDINVSRVKNRAKLGGHPVREQLIRSRYPKSHANLLGAIAEAHRGAIWDNSGAKPYPIAYITNGEIDIEPVTVPDWFNEAVLKHLEESDPSESPTEED